MSDSAAISPGGDGCPVPMVGHTCSGVWEFLEATVERVLGQVSPAAVSVVLCFL